MLRNFYFGIFLLVFVKQGIFTEIPSYNCSKNEWSDCVLRVDLTSNNKNFEIIPDQDVSNIKSVVINGKMEILTSDVCDTLPNIESFWASEVSLMSVEGNAFRKCWNMTFVVLHKNQLEILPLKLFSNNLNLKVLDLSSNQLTQVLSVPEMPVMKNLNTINLNDNQLSDVDVETIIANCPNLERIDLYRNKFGCARQHKIIETLTANKIRLDIGECITTLPGTTKPKRTLRRRTTNAITRLNTQKTPKRTTTTSTPLPGASGEEFDLSIEINSFSARNCGNIVLADGYVIEGEKRDEGKFSWVSAMYVRGKYACNANFISRTRAVTAAHCFVKNPQAADIELLIFSKRSVSVKNFKKHPNFEKIPKYDIAILDTEEIYEDRFVPVCLPIGFIYLVGDQGEVVSWTPSPNQNETELLSAKLSVVRNRYCKVVEPQVPKHSFCVKHGHAGAWLCKGDSGAGFVVLAQNLGIKSRDKRYFLHGLVSTGLTTQNDECIEDYVILTDVTKFLSFVLS